MLRKIILLLLITMLSTPFALAQAERQLAIPDKENWSNLTLPRISADGGWVSYVLQYEKNTDTLFLQHIQTSRKYALPSAGNAAFSQDGKWFAAMDPVRGLALVGLATGKLEWFAGASNYEFHSASDLLLVYGSAKGAQELLAVNLNDNSRNIFTGVCEYKIGFSGKIAIRTETEIAMISPDIGYKKTIVIRLPNNRFKKLTWNRNGNQLAFLEDLPAPEYTRSSHKIYHYDAVEGQTKTLDAVQHESLSDQQIIVPLGKPAIQFSDEGSALLFYRASYRLRKLAEESPEVWDSMSVLEYPAQMYQSNTAYLAKLTQWNQKIDSVQYIGTNEHPSALLLHDREKVLSFNKLVHEPQFELEAPIDLFLTDLQTGGCKLILEKHWVAPRTIGASPSAHYINYFRENNWWIYDILLDRHCNLSAGIKTSLSAIGGGGESGPYGSPGWSSDGKCLIIYDRYDIWLLPVNGEKPKRITQGHEVGMQYRIAENSENLNNAYNPLYLQQNKFSLKRGLLLETLSLDMKSGYSFWKSGKEIRRLVSDDYSISNLHKADHGNGFIYVRQSMDSPPSIMHLRNVTGSPKILVQSNEHQKKGNWGQAELISYRSNEKNLKGILYYPRGFYPKKKYPLIVYVYERLSQNLHTFYKPGFENGDGFNPANYFLDGYLVLFPDIEYRIGAPGPSALTCVTAAVDTVVAKGMVQRNKIGIIGHSFGGYEVSYIITQTNMFAAAVAGAGITDMVSNYFSMHQETAHSNMWRYESQQLRMGIPPFTNFGSYLNNSPIANADKISTPLLSWTGKEDKNVNWSQSLELHMALRRLQKKNVLLVYPNEGHLLSDVDNRKDLGLRIKNWFDSFLK